ncbi:hypothetical protein STRCR_2133 [Streptococcus criceti HS-6]|uniref:Uncharacterized protein n=1 Tax=Streptococcus criceti HS-6 TaxID=873449 RepID=G5JS53_STRCG|nr:hypothetical protein STRCR_2133 [Streptococcus criceti HS-6]
MGTLIQNDFLSQFQSLGGHGQSPDSFMPSPAEKNLICYERLMIE